MKLFKKNISMNNTAGFTLIETLVSILIFSISITALLVITSGGVSDVSYSKKKQTAYLLAQEGIELVRIARDTELRSGGGWLGFVTGTTACTSPGGCTIDTQRFIQNANLSINGCTQNGCSVLFYNNSNGSYGYTSGDKTDYVRTIRMKPVGGANPEEMRLNSSVTWTHGGEEFEIVMQEVITGWVNQSPV